MGNYISSFLWPDYINISSTRDISENVDSKIMRLDMFGRAKKRAFPFKKMDNSPSKMIRLDTAKYLHQKLFVEGRKSDVTIQALGHEWHLHKIYLEQCDYFRCLFNGNWSDSANNCYALSITDERVTFEGLNSVFASLYQNEIQFELKDLGGILATAALFNLQICIERCEELIIQSISDDTVIEFLELSQCYGCLEARQSCIDFLSRLFWKLSQSDDFLAKLNYELMVLILSQQQLCIADGERDMYNAVKRWLYIQDTKKLGSSTKTIQEHITSKPPNYYHKYSKLLQHIRYQHLITSDKTLNTLRSDHIIGTDILNLIITDQWTTLLKNEEKALLEDDITDDYFYAHCRRLGRVLDEDKGWRWGGLDFGLDLVMRCHMGVISMTRNVSSDPINQSLSMRKDYKIHYRLLVLNPNGDIVTDSKRKKVELGVNQKHFVVSYPVDLKGFSVHLFYLNHVPFFNSRHYWNDLELSND